MLSYDADGNVTSEVDTAAGSGLQRTITTGYLYDDADWLHDQPRLTQTYAGSAGNALPLRATLTCYDDDTSPECKLPLQPQPPPAVRGLVLATRQLDGTTWVTTGSHLYDKFGNQVAATDADGHTTTTSYDSAGLFPIKDMQRAEAAEAVHHRDRLGPRRRSAHPHHRHHRRPDHHPGTTRSAGPTGPPGPPASITTTQLQLHRHGTTTFTDAVQPARSGAGPGPRHRRARPRRDAP